jgi:predicted deacylase
MTKIRKALLAASRALDHALAALAAAGAAVASALPPKGWAESGTREGAEPASLALSYFSSDYEEARARFRAASAAAGRAWPGAESRAFRVPSASEPDLTVDYLYLPAQKAAKSLVIITSGVHGMEGYAGSAAQLMFLAEQSAGLEREATGYILAHALNPFGFKRHRRATENNVNLNRNFSASGELYQRKNPGYDRLRPILEPQGQVARPWLSSLAASVGLIARVLSRRISFFEVSQSVGAGQFSWPRGLEYGGAGPEPQVADFFAYLKRKAEPYEAVILFDVHTGLGQSYQLHLMPGDDSQSADPATLAALFDRAADADIYAFTPSDTEGFYRTYGDINNSLPSLLSRAQRSLAVTMEFGTVGEGALAKLKTLNRVILENQGFNAGYASDAARAEVERSFAALFYPEDRRWKENVVARSRATFARALARLRAR